MALDSALLQDEDVDRQRASVQKTCCAAAAGILWFRFTDGFARNMLFANQIDVFQRFMGSGDRAAQQFAQGLSALGSASPALVGVAVERWNVSPLRAVQVGCILELCSFCTITWVASGLVHIDIAAVIVGISMFGAYTPGYGAIACSVPTLGRSVVEPSQRAAFMQNFFATLACGSIFGILVSGVVQVRDAYVFGFALALLVLLLGVAALFNGVRDSIANWEPKDNGQGSEAPQRRWPLVALVPFYAAYAQWTTSWYVQAEHMNREFYGVELPVDTFQAVERVIVLASLLLLRRAWSAGGASCTALALFPLRRLALGSLLASFALALAGFAERVRRDWVPRLPDDDEVSNMSVLWLLPQYATIAVAEAFVFPAQTEWASSSPELVGLACAAQALATAALGALLPLLQDWVPESSPNDGHYDNYFFILAGLAAFAAIPLSLASGQ